MSVTLSDIQAAQARIAPHIHPTPLEPSTLGARVWLKLENANLTHSFKIRGALNAVLSLSDAQKARGVVAASSGNHAQGLAYAAKLAGVDAQIVVPAVTPQRKLNGIRRYGAQAIISAGNYDAAEAQARQIEAQAGRTFVSAYNDAHVVAGQGTIGLEILQQLPDVQRVVVCVSGGGLIAGIATAIKALKPSVEVIGVCAQASPAMYNRFYGTHLPAAEDTLAEALAGDIEDGCITVPITRQWVDALVLVSEDDIAQAVAWALYEAGWVIEGGGAVGIAALRSGVIPPSDALTAVVVSGGNIDAPQLHRISQQYPPAFFSNA